MRGGFGAVDAGDAERSCVPGNETGTLELTWAVDGCGSEAVSVSASAFG